MRTIEYLFDPALAGLYWPAVVAGAAIAMSCAALSPWIVLKRMAFVGQGVSHAAFGGIGVARILGLGAAASAAHTFGTLGVVLVFCLVAAALIAVLAERRGMSDDAAIGIVLVGAMALGAILIDLAARRPGAGASVGWESILFGSILGVGWFDVAWAWGVASLVVVALITVRRDMLFWACDEAGAEIFGVSTLRVRLVMMVLITFVVVSTMKLAGVVLTTALLVLPGACALRWSDRLSRVAGLSAAVGGAGTIAGLVLSFELDLPPGPGVVAALLAAYLLTWLRR